MKKLFVLIMALVLCFSLVACTVNVDTNAKDNNDDDDKKTTAEDTDKAASKALSVIKNFLEATGEIEYGTCSNCGEECGKMDFLCKECMNSNECIRCYNDLEKAGDILCDDCIESLEGYESDVAVDIPVNSYEDYYDFNDYYEDYYRY